MDAYAAARLLVGTAILSLAAFSDVRTRRVRDPLWVALGTLGLVIVSAELLMEGTSLARLALLPATAILFYTVFYGKPILDEDGLHLRPARVALLGVAAALIVGSADVAIAAGGAESAAYVALLTMPVMVLVYQGFYYLRILHGGADAKAFIALALLLPTYPNAAPFPILSVDPRILGTMQILFPFSLVVLANAAILFLAVPLVTFAYNTVRGDLAFPQALFGTRADLDALPEHAWLMERVTKGGERVLVLFPRRGTDRSEQVRRLREAGVRRVWVQPKVPFLVPVLAGFLLAFFAGNVLLGFLTAILPMP